MKSNGLLMKIETATYCRDTLEHAVLLSFVSKDYLYPAFCKEVQCLNKSKIAVLDRFFDVVSRV